MANLTAMIIAAIIIVVIAAGAYMTLSNKGASNTPTVSSSVTASQMTTVQSTSVQSSALTTANMSSVATCAPMSGFSCTRLATGNGNITFIFAQLSGYTFYNFRTSCSTGSSAPTQFTNFTGRYVPNGAKVQLSNVQCYSSSGSPAAGSVSSGSIWISYTLKNSTFAANNPRYTAEIATFASAG